MNVKTFVKNNFNKSAFVDVSFSEFKKGYAPSMRGFDIAEVAKELGINTTEKKAFKVKKEVGKNK